MLNTVLRRPGRRWGAGRSAIFSLAVLTVGLGMTPARAQGPIVLGQTTYKPNGARELSLLEAFAVTNPATGAVSEWRQFKYTTPANFAARPPASVNLWFVYHGGGGNTDTMNRYFELIPSSAPTVVVFPEALVGMAGATRWRTIQFPGDEKDPDVYKDIPFTEQLRANLLANNPQLSADHVYASGFSAGGSATWMLLCYRSSLFRGFAMYSKQLQKVRRDGGCGDGRIYDPVVGTYSIPTGYELLTGQPPDFYGYNGNLPSQISANPTKPVFYEHGTFDENLDYTGTPGCAASNPPTCPPTEDPDLSMSGAGSPTQNRDDIATKDWLLARHDLRDVPVTRPVPDQDPANGFDMVVSTARGYGVSRNTPGVTSRSRVNWIEMSAHVHAMSALDHKNDDCDNIFPGGPAQTPCNSNPNASKDFDTSLVTKRFFERSAGMLR